MTAAVYRSGTPSLSVPETQNTAPVLEFNCMYTHDVRRKQKRWQDGFLRFHTFNKRIMVYDIPRNFIGDVHWKAEEVLQDGDEVTLERDGILVQVAESVGSTETDLTELRRSKKKTSSEVGSSSPVRASAATATAPPKRTTSKPTTQLKHRSLNALLGTPKGPIGKASLPAKSPFEERVANAENEEWSVDRPAKRMRMDEPPLWNVVRTTTTSKHAPAHKGAPRNSTVTSAKSKRAPLENGQRRLDTREIIDLSMEDNDREKFMAGFSSEALAPPSSPQKQQSPAKKVATVRSSSPAFQTQQAPKRLLNQTTASTPPKEPAKTNSSRELKRTEQDRSNKAVAKSDRQKQSLEKAKPDKVAAKSARPEQPPPVVKRPVDPLNGYLTQPPKEDDTGHSEVSPITRRPDSKSGKTLRMNASAPKKKTLLCQEQVSKKPSRVHSTNTENAIGVLLDVASQESPPDRPKAKSQQRQLEDRLAKIERKGRTDRATSPEIPADAVDWQSANSFIKRPKESRPKAPQVDAAEEVARLDRLIMPPTRSPSPLPVSEAPAAPAPPQPIERQLRRVVSETSKPLTSAAKRKPGDPVRYTPSPAKKIVPFDAQKEPANQNLPQPKPASALPPETRARTTLQRSVSLNTISNGTPTVILGRPFQAPKAPAMKPAVPEKAPDPWSREAFDLFTWRPPGWDEENWCLRVSDGAAQVPG